MAKDPDRGRLKPSAHIFSRAAIPSGLVHLEKSSKGIFSLLSGVSIISLHIKSSTYGRIVIIVVFGGRSVESFNKRAKE